MVRSVTASRRPAEAPATSEVSVPADDEGAVLARVGEALRRIRFGTVLLVVQDGKVVQIETAEKFRLR
jgi:hypothetical protein